MKPTDALEQHAYFKSKTLDWRWKKLLLSFIEVSTGRKHKYSDAEWEASNHKKALEVYVDDCVDTAKSGETFFVKEEMTDLILFASKKLEKTDAFDISLVPADKGFTYFEKPIPVTDIRGRTLYVNVFLWKKCFNETTGEFQLSVSYWNDTERTPDDIATQVLSTQSWKEQMAILGRFHWVKSGCIFEGERLGEDELGLSEKVLEETRKITFREDNIEKHEPLSDEEWEAYKKEVLRPSTNITRVMWAYFLIMSQTLTEVAKQPAENRTQRRRLERENLPSEVVVVQFRKRRYVSAGANEAGEENAVDWSHRWIVGGHWRWQPYKDPVSKGVIKKRIWISPYVKGPDDKPLKTKERVYVLAK